MALMTVMCGECAFNALEGKFHGVVPATDNPTVDGWKLTESGDLYFDPSGKRVWLCPDCAEEHKERLR